jgi:hypothetical protein
MIPKPFITRVAGTGELSNEFHLDLGSFNYSEKHFTLVQ